MDTANSEKARLLKLKSEIEKDIDELKWQRIALIGDSSPEGRAKYTYIPKFISIKQQGLWDIDKRIRDIELQEEIDRVLSQLHTVHDKNELEDLLEERFNCSLT